MATPALVDALVDFAARTTTHEGTQTQQRREPAIDLAARLEERDGEWEARLASEVAAARSTLSAELAAAHAAELDALRESHAAEVAALCATLGTEGGARIASALAEAEARIGELTGNLVARLLGGALTSEIGRRSADRLVAIIGAAVRDDEAVRIEIEGPAALYEPLRERLEDFAGQLRFVDAAMPDLRVTIDERVYETRLAEWNTTLTELAR